MEISIHDLRLANTCPLLLEQNGLYHEVMGRSRILTEELRTIFNNVFYQTMRGRRLNPARIAKYWKETVARVGAARPLTQDEVRFPAQCLAMFMDTYTTEPPEEIVGPSVPFEVPVSQHVIVTDTYPLLTRTNYGTRITVFEFEPQIRPDLHYANDFFYTIYAHAYRREFSKKEFGVRVHNLGDGKMCDLIKTDDLVQRHLSHLESQAELVYTKHRVPNLAQCPGCPVAGHCHVRRYAGQI